MPCLVPKHIHIWPATGQLTIQKCERLCGYCHGENAKHVWKYPWFLRRHARTHIRHGDHPDVEVLDVWTETHDGPHTPKRGARSLTGSPELSKASASKRASPYPSASPTKRSKSSLAQRHSSTRQRASSRRKKQRSPSLSPSPSPQLTDRDSDDEVAHSEEGDSDESNREHDLHTTPHTHNDFAVTATTPPSSHTLCLARYSPDRPSDGAIRRSFDHMGLDDGARSSSPRHRRTSSTAHGYAIAGAEIESFVSSGPYHAQSSYGSTPHLSTGTVPTNVSSDIDPNDAMHSVDARNAYVSAMQELNQSGRNLGLTNEDIGNLMIDEYNRLAEQSMSFFGLTDDLRCRQRQVEKAFHEARLEEIGRAEQESQSRLIGGLRFVPARAFATQDDHAVERQEHGNVDVVHSSPVPRSIFGDFVVDSAAE